MNSLLKTLRQDFEAITFVPAEEFRWSPADQTVYYDENHPNRHALLLHELAHGILGHHTYERDVHLVGLEMEAWEKARNLASTYSIPINEDSLQDHLDTYREWLHARSSCPDCSANGHQVEKARYRCLACSTDWRVNEARVCALRRYTLSTK